MRPAEMSVLKPVKVIFVCVWQVDDHVSTQPQKSFLNKANTAFPNSNQNTRKSKSLQLNLTWTIWEKKPTTTVLLHAPWKRVRVINKAPFLPLLGAGCTLSLFASSMGLRYYITQCWKTYPESTRVSETLHQGIPSSLWYTALEHYWAGPCSCILSSQRHLPCTCSNPLSIHSRCTPYDPVQLFYLPTHQANVLGGYSTIHLLQIWECVLSSPYPFPIHCIVD